MDLSQIRTGGASPGEYPTQEQALGKSCGPWTGARAGAGSGKHLWPLERSWVQKWLRARATAPGESPGWSTLWGELQTLERGLVRSRLWAGAGAPGEEQMVGAGSEQELRPLDKIVVGSRLRPGSEASGKEPGWEQAPDESRSRWGGARSGADCVQELRPQERGRVGSRVQVEVWPLERVWVLSSLLEGAVTSGEEPGWKQALGRS